MAELEFELRQSAMKSEIFITVAYFKTNSEWNAMDFLQGI